MQSVNRGRLTFAKAETDLSEVLKAPNGTPHRFRFVTRSAFSAKMRGKIVFLPRRRDSVERACHFGGEGSI